LLEAIIESSDRVAIEGDNQKQADFLASAQAKANRARRAARCLRSAASAAFALPPIMIFGDYVIFGRSILLAHLRSCDPHVATRNSQEFSPLVAHPSRALTFDIGSILQ
jgi:hypothetical protein